MKKSNLFLILFALISSLSYSQTQLYKEKLKKELVPEKILQSLEKDFPDVTIVKYEGLPITLVKGELYVGSEENANSGPYDNYVITLAGKSGNISAAYDAEGHLINTFERLKNVALPENIVATIGKDFRGWAVKGDKVRMTSYRDGKKIAHYKVRLEKDGIVEHVVFDEMGKIVKTPKDLHMTEREVG